MSKQAKAALIVALSLVAMALWWASQRKMEATPGPVAAIPDSPAQLAEASTQSTDDDVERAALQAARAQDVIAREIAALEAELENLDPQLDSMVYLERALALVRVRCQLSDANELISPPGCIEPLGRITQVLNVPMTASANPGDEKPSAMAATDPETARSPQHIEVKQMLVRRFTDTDSAVVQVAIMRLFGMMLNSDNRARDVMNGLLTGTEGSLARSASEVRFGLGQDVDDSTVENARITLLEGHAAAIEPACNFLARAVFRDRDGHVEWIQQQIMATSPRIRVRLCLVDVLSRLGAKTHMAALAQWASEETAVAPGLKKRISELAGR